jgi:membrane peptidoglycan carboxypeptidase
MAFLLVALAGLAAWWEARTSWLQARWFTDLAAQATYLVLPGPYPQARLPASGPYDLRLGYSLLDSMVERAAARGFEVVAQARLSEGFHHLLDQGAFPIYREKDQAGLILLDSRGEPFLKSLYPRQIYASFDSVPPPVRDALLFIENRELLSPRHPHQNPAVEWGRMARSVVDLALNKLGFSRNVPGASTLATQIEKYRHSPEGLTATPTEKLRQMASASLRAYMDGPNTLERRREIVTQYLNSVPLAAVAGYGEVIGLSDGLWAWYGTDFQEVNALLLANPDTLDEAQALRRAEVYRQVLSLLLAQRRPSYYLASGSGQEALRTLTDQYLRLMTRRGVVPEELGMAALEAQARPRVESPPLPRPPFVERKAQNQVRAGLLPLLGVPQLYDLDRYDLVVETSLNYRWQRIATEALVRMNDPAFVREAGFGEVPMLHRGDPSRVIYSFTLTERTPEGNRIRIQTDNFDGPFNINEGSRIELGSTAKLRTLVTYLELVEKLHEDLSPLPRDSLRALSLSIPRRDLLGRWGVEYLLAHPEVDRRGMLEAAMERGYSANPRERFVTGGGTQVFSNFDTTYDQRVMSVSQAFHHSVNLVWVRVMRDIISHLMYGSPTSMTRVLEDAGDPARQEYLARFADTEGGVFVDRFFRKYAGQPPDSILPVLFRERRLSPLRMAWAFRSVAPEAPPEELASFIEEHAHDATLTEAALRDMYRRTDPEGQSLADLGYLASVHPLELWVARFLRENPESTRAQVNEASRPHRQEVYAWLFRTSRRNAQDIRIRSILEMEAFNEVLRMWNRVGYPFDNIVPSLGSSIGSSGDRPAALAELVGILLNDGVLLPSVRVEELQFAVGTPYEVILRRRPVEGTRILSSEVSAVARQALWEVVTEGTGRRLRTALIAPDGALIPVGGKTGTGDNRFRVFAPGGRLLESRPVNRTSTFVFFVEDRYFGVITAYVPGPEAGDFGFTASLPAELLRRLLGELDLFPEG